MGLSRAPSFTRAPNRKRERARQAPSPAARMGACSSQEQELNEDLERVRKERAERDRVANLIRVKVTSPPPGCEIEINKAVTVRVFLEEVAPLFGLNKSAAPSLQAEFSETILGHDLRLNGAGMCDESLCSVLGVEAALLASVAKANNMDIVKAAAEGRIADVNFVLQHAPEKVNDQNKKGSTALHQAAFKNSTQVAEVLVAANANVDVKTDRGQTALHYAADNNSLEVAEVLVAANANVDIKDEDGLTALQRAVTTPSKKHKRRNNQAVITLLSSQ